MTLTVALACAAALLALGPFAVIIGRFPAATHLVYGASMVVAAISLIAAAVHRSLPRGITVAEPTTAWRR